MGPGWREHRDKGHQSPPPNPLCLKGTQNAGIASTGARPDHSNWALRHIHGASSGRTGWSPASRAGRGPVKGGSREDVNEGLQVGASGLPPAPMAWRWACDWLSHLRRSGGPAEDTGDPGSSTSYLRGFLRQAHQSISGDSTARLLPGQMSNVK